MPKPHGNSRLAKLEKALEPFARVLDGGWGSSLLDDLEMNVCRADHLVIGCKIPVRAFRRATAILSGRRK